MPAQVLVHLEHVGRLLAEYLCQLVIGINLSPVLGVLQIVFLDTSPDFAHDLAAGQVVRRWPIGRLGV